MRKYHLLLAFAGILLYSCQQEIDPSIITGNNNGNNNNNNTSNSYQPTGSGSWWKYKDSASAAISTSTATSLTKTINGIVYTKVVSVSGAQTDTGYYASPSPNYYFSAAGQSPNTGSPYDLTFHYLNDTASVGYNWTYNGGQGNGFTAIFKTTILEKNLTVVVAGKTYTNVIHTRMDLVYDIFGTQIDSGWYDFYVSKGVGIIRIRANPGNFGASFTTCSELIDHHIQ
jgi:hypothetical protein